MSKKEPQGAISFKNFKKEEKELKGYTETELREIKRKEMEEAKQREEAKPRSERRKKVENFFFHYKAHVIVGIISVMVVSLFVKDMFFAVKPDIMLILGTSKVVPIEYSESLARALEPYVGDFNGDGKVKVLVDAIQIPNPARSLEEGGGPMEEGGYAIAGDPQAEMAGSMKLMAILASGTEHLFLLDEPSYAYLTGSEGSSTPGELFEVLSFGEGEESSFFAFAEAPLLETENMWLFEDYKFYLRIPQKANKIKPDFYNSQTLLTRLHDDILAEDDIPE